MSGPQPYDEKVRLAGIISDARKLLADSGFAAERTGWAARCGRLEAMLKMLADSAEVFTPYAAGTGGEDHE